LDDETEDDEEEITTPTTEGLISAASRIGFSIEELIQAEAKLYEVGKASHSSPDSEDFRCPRAGKIIRAITRGKSLKHQVKPWKGPLPKPRVSPPRTLGDAMIKNSCIRLRGGRLMLQSFKMTLPSTTNDLASNSVDCNDSAVRFDEWPSLPASQSSKSNSEPAAAKVAKSAKARNFKRAVLR
jgi:hypothetical protein